MIKILVILSLGFTVFATAAEAPLFVEADNLLFGNPPTREIAWEKLKTGDRAQIVSLIVERLRTERRGRRHGDPVTERQAAILEGLGRFGKDGLPAFVEYFKKDFYVSKADHDSLAAYFRKSGEAAVPALFELAKVPQEDVRTAVAYVLGQIPEVSLVRLKAEMKSEDQNRQAIAARAIAKAALTDDVKLPLLIEMASGTGDSVSWARGGLVDLREKALPTLKAAIAVTSDARTKKRFEAIVTEIERKSEVDRVIAEFPSAKPSAPELKAFVGTFATGNPKTLFGEARFEWKSDRLVGTFRGQEDFAEHGQGYYETGITDAGWTSSGRLTFTIGKRTFYRSVAKIGKGGDVGGGRSVIHFSCERTRDGIVCVCGELPLYGCAYNRVPLVKR